ncbi:MULTISPECIES: VOC family protein [unclassified Streptomyces]|uniref:VOC family protein n=1 Tax=unclassified Streptomyces TaxID=2593676 RepID=UPI0006F5E2E0|nr:MULTISPECIES: VOC family protein [unclassified Streptomyces]KQX53030.1 glyoxalase [Streptomyces sp. Root1304]KRA89950.1 glyoxalase [Streptomyces sp. Root66D1]
MAPQMIFVNLPVKDVSASKTFFEKLGYSINPAFSDETTGCVVISDTIFAMLLEEPKFQSFMAPGKEISDATKSTEVLVTLSAESRAKVDELADAALAAGGTPAKEPLEMGFMYGRSFTDLDGHHWEIFWMDPAAAQG